MDEEREKNYNLIRKTLRGDARKRRFTPDDIIIEDDVGDTKKCCCAQRLRVFNEEGATNLKWSTGPNAALWDSWGIYYCPARFGRRTHLNVFYFSIVSLFIMGQGSLMLNLIYYMHTHGGAAFLVTLVLVYITLGYPMYVFETSMGQYSGRKPIAMLRFMLPALSGLGPALYLRTFIKAINALSTVLYCILLAFSLFFCKPDSLLVYRFLAAETRNKKFDLLGRGRDHKQAGTKKHHVYHWWQVCIVMVVLLVLVLQSLKTIGLIARVLSRVLLLGMLGYMAVALSRIYPASGDSIVFIPLKKTFSPEWIKMFNGTCWLDATVFVVQSLELGTLVHPYLGSKCFFHYRCHRDGLYLVLLAIVWYLISVIAALAWLGYIGVGEEEIKRANEHLFGHYGLYIVYYLKHVQAEMTQQVQGDLLFFNACFYSIVGISAFCALIVYIIIIVDCSFPEHGQYIMKCLTLVGVVMFFGGLLPFGLLHDEGLRRLIFVNFYVHKNWSVFFVIACYFGAVAWGHDLGKFLHDFLNMLHLKGYQFRHHSYKGPRTLRYLIMAFLLIGMVCFMFYSPFPHEGDTDWRGGSEIAGLLFSLVPMFVIVSIAVYNFRVYGLDALKPHRNWFKNKHHVGVCAADYSNFRGIPALVEPQEHEQ